MFRAKKGLMTEISEKAETETRSLGFRKRVLDEIGWHTMLEKRIRCRKTSERTGGKKRTEQSGRTERKDMGNAEGGVQYGEAHQHQPERQAVLVGTGCAGPHIEWSSPPDNMTRPRCPNVEASQKKTQNPKNAHKTTHTPGSSYPPVETRLWRSHK